MEKNVIYALIDPRNGHVRYVGQSSRGMARAQMHRFPSVLKTNTNPHKCNWVRQLQRGGVTFEAELLEVCSSKEELDEAEEFWISYFRFLGADLTNKTAGGQGVRGFKYLGRPCLPETREKIAASKRGKPRNSETREKIGIAHRGKVRPHHGRNMLSEVSRRRVSESLRGKVQSEVTRKRRAEAMAQYWSDVRSGHIARDCPNHGKRKESAPAVKRTQMSKVQSRT